MPRRVGRPRNRGGSLKMSGNGAISGLLGKIPIIGKIAGTPFRMVGLGARRRRAPRRVQHRGGASDWGKVLNQIVNVAGTQAMTDLGRLTSKL